MADGRPAPSGVGRALLRRWWFILLVAAVAGSAAYLLTDRATSERIYGIVNTRTVVTAANDRVDLVEDLTASLTLPSVLRGPAAEHDTSVAALRRDVTVEPIAQTSFVRVGIVVHDGDHEGAEELLRALIDSASRFMSGEDGSLPAAEQDPLAVQLRFLDQREAALGLALEAEPEGSERVAELEDELADVVGLRRTVEQQVAEQEAVRAERRVQLPLTLEGRDNSRGGSDTQLRRTASGAAAGALLGCLVVAALHLRSRRRARST